MNVKEYLEKNGLNIFKHVDKKFNELKDQFIEMSQLKSDFDIEKFTIRKEGNFIAHMFHFLMRQYSLTLSELRRMLIEKKEFERKILEYNKKGMEKIIVYNGHGKEEKFADLYVEHLINQLDLLEINIANKSMSIRYFELMRLKIIEMNDGEVPTNEQYQKEEPEYWKWFLTMRAKEQLAERQTGIKEGVWLNVGHLEQPAMLNDEFYVPMLDEKGSLNLDYKKKDKRLLNGR
jgi:hypothetical protein